MTKLKYIRGEMLWVFFFLTFLVLQPHQEASALDGESLKNALQESLEKADLGEDARFAALVLDPKTGEIVFDLNSEVPMKPASVTKTFTMAASLDQISHTHRFTTLVATNGAIDGHTLKGDLVIVGGGDPSLGPRSEPNKEMLGIFEEWAEYLKRMGIEKIDGDIIGDDSFFPDDRWGQGWYPNEKAEWYMAEISALAFNDNCIDVSFNAEGEIGESATITKIAPPGDYSKITSEVEIIAENEDAKGVDFFRDDEKMTVRAVGSLNKDKTRTRWTAVPDPARYTAHTFHHVLTEGGITITGGIASRHRDGDEPNRYRTILIKHESPMLGEFLSVILDNSQNLYTEMVGRVAAMEAGLPATFEGGVDLIKMYLVKNEIPMEGFELYDTSGLSSKNRIMPLTIGRLLENMYGDTPLKRLYRESMADSRESGSIRSRLKEVEGVVDAKTGSLGDTKSLAGYLTLPSGKDYVFVVMNDLAEKGGARDQLDEAVELIEKALLSH